MAIFQVDEREELYTLVPGELIGRSDQAAICLDDPRISEAHAMVSLRGQGLKLLPLRGRFRVDGETVHEVLLSAGLCVELAPDLFMLCVEVILPNSVLSVVFSNLPRIVPSGTTTLYLTPRPRIKHGYDPSGAAILWAVGGRWRIHLAERGETLELESDLTMELGGERLELRQVPLLDTVYPSTRSTLEDPPKLERCGNGVKAWLDGPEERCVLITGIPGKICAALLDAGNSASVQEIIEVVWEGDLSTPSALRKRFDMGLSRLRERFTELGFEAAMIQLDGTGTLTLEPSPLSARPLPTTSAGGQDGSL